MVRRSFTDAAGRRHFVRGSDADDAADKLLALKTRIEKQLLSPHYGMTVREWSKSYLDVIVRPATNIKWSKDITHMIESRILPEIGSMRIDQIRPLHLQKILIHAQDLSYSYRYKLTLEIKRMFRQARINKIIEDDPAESLKLPPRKDETIGRALTDRERELVAYWIPQHRFGLEVALMLYAGLRDQEVIGLDRSKVDLESRELIIDQARKSDGTLGKPKSLAGTRRVPIQNSLLELLQERMRLDGKPNDPVCVQMRGTRHTKESFRSGWQNFLRELNLHLGAQTYRLKLVGDLPISMDVRPYYLRHTFCTDCEKAGIPVQVTARIMGHSSINITLRYYTHASRTVQQMALAALNGSKWHAFGTLDSPLQTIPDPKTQK